MEVRKLLISSLLVAQSALVWAQQPETTVALCDQLRNSGRVQIYQDARLDALLTRRSKVYNAASHMQYNKDGKMVISSPGFRVRVFSGNNQTVSRNEAMQIEKDLKEYLPELSTYLIFKSPNWRLLVGNFHTAEEATAMLRDLKRHFPRYGQEMFVVKDEIEVFMTEEK